MRHISSTFLNRDIMNSRLSQVSRPKALFAAITIALTLGVNETSQAVEATDVNCTGCVGNVDLEDGSVTTEKIADGTIGTADLADGSVTSTKLAPGVIGTTYIANGSITSQKIKDGTIATADLANGSVATEKIADGTIATVDLADVSVTSVKIAAGAVGTANLAAGAVGTANIAAGAVGTANIAAGAVSTANLADGGVTSAKIANAAIGTAKLANKSVTTAKIADGSVTSAKLAPGAVVLGVGSVTSSTIMDGTIATLDLANNSVTNAKIADGSVTSAKLASEVLGPLLDRITALENEVAVLKGISSYSQATLKGTYKCRELGVGTTWTTDNTSYYSGVVYSSGDATIVADGLGTATFTAGGDQAEHGLYVTGVALPPSNDVIERLISVPGHSTWSDEGSLPYTVGAGGRVTFNLGLITETFTGWVSMDGDTVVMQFVDNDESDRDYFRALSSGVRTARGLG